MYELTRTVVVWDERVLGMVHAAVLLLLTLQQQDP